MPRPRPACRVPTLCAWGRTSAQPTEIERRVPDGGLIPVNDPVDWTPSLELGQLLALRRAERGTLHHRSDEVFGGCRPAPTWLVPHVATLLEAGHLHRVTLTCPSGASERFEPTASGYRLLRDLEARQCEATTGVGLDIRVRDRVLLLGDTDPLHERLQAAVSRADLIGMPADSPLSQIAGRAPYDRIIVSAPTRAVAWAWVQHTRPGGLLLCVLNPTGLASRCVALRCYPDRACGRFLDDGQGLAVPQFDPGCTPYRPSRADRDTRRARTNMPMRVWQLGVPWYLAAATMPDGLTLSRVHDDVATDRGIRLATDDGSWCEITTGHPDDRRHVAEGGQQDLFGHLVRTHRQWHDLGQPGWDRLTLTVTPDEHVIRLDDGAAEWRLPE